MVKPIVKKVILCSAMFCVLPFVGLSQNLSSIRGVVIDSKNSDPIPFATVALKSRYFGVITNEDGSFTLPISISDTVRQFEISCLGYESRVVNIQGIETDKLLTYRLKPILYDIEEVRVIAEKQRAKSAAEIVSKAVKSINSNYPNFPFLLDGYYRDYLKVDKGFYREYLKIDDGYVNMYEALVQLQDNGFNTVEKEETSIGLLYGTYNKLFPVDTNLITNYNENKIVPYGETGYNGGNELYFLLIHNPIRNYLDSSFAFIKRIQYEFLTDHQFTLLGKEFIDSVLCYKIGISYPESENLKSENPQYSTGSASSVGGAAGSRSNYKATGYIFIQADNFRIHNLSYQVYYQKLRLWGLNVSYKDVAGVFYLNYLSFNNLIEEATYLDEHYFYLKKSLVDKVNKRLTLFFNNPIDVKSVKNQRSFRLKFDGNRLRVSQVAAGGKYVQLSIGNFNETLDYMESQDSDRLDIVIKKIRDIYGNKIDDIKTVRSYQYREFFVSNASTHFDSIPKNQLLDRNKSIFLDLNTKQVLPDSLKFNSPLIGKD